MSSGVSLDIWDEIVPSSPAENSSKFDYYMPPVNRPGVLPSPSGGDLGPSGGNFGPSGGDFGPRREPHSAAPIGFPGQRHGAMSQSLQRGQTGPGPQRSDMGSGPQRGQSGPGPQRGDMGPPPLRGNMGPPPSRGAQQMAHYPATREKSMGEPPGVSWQQQPSPAPVTGFPANPVHPGALAPAPPPAGPPPAGVPLASRNFYDEIRNGSGLEYYGGKVASEAAPASCKGSHNMVTIRDFFWVKCCIVVCMILLLIIVFQLNRICRHLSEKK